MASLDLLRRHLFATAIGVGLLVGCVIGLFLPIRAASPPKASNETWSLPTVNETKRFRQEDYLALRAGRFWKTVESTGQRGTPKLEWTLAAIITRPQPMAAITQSGGRPQANQSADPASNLVAVGRELPDGSKLVRMTPDAVWFEKDGCLRERRLYRAVTAENNACLGEAKTAPTIPSPAPATKTTPSLATPSPTATPSAIPLQTGTNPVRPAPPIRSVPKAAGAATP